jgi:quinol monooxygenase YgiN
MVIVHVQAQVRDDARNAFLAAMSEQVRLTQAEDGCLAYAAFESAAKPNAFIVVERWTSIDTMQAHLDGARTQRFLAQVGAWLAAAPLMETFVAEPIEPS